jgi:F-type H+-transporting ATPase subunit epsilon
MPATFHLEIATPERLLVQEPNVLEAQIPGKNGYLGILPEHAPLLGELGTGELTYRTTDRIQNLAVSGGWLEVLPDRVRVLATIAERASEIDKERAQAALRRAEERLAGPKEAIDVARALNALKRAQARLSAAQHK